ncbi:MAG: amidohydrolase [Proteobacteria bacterium]|nr:amidohydrolase [Pseudomonadota bacterium]
MLILVAAALTAQIALVHGKIITVDANDSTAQALAIRDGRIMKVGTDAEVLALTDARTQIIDLKGRTATPGLIDTHAHISGGGWSDLYEVPLADAANVAEVVARVKAAVAKAKPGEWIQGRGWDEGKLAEHRYLTAADLDAVSPNNPVWLTHTTSHYGVANSAALKLAKIGAGSADPAAGTIDRNANGKATGVLKESAQALVVSLLPEASADQRRKGIEHIVQVLNREGMTGAKDPGIGPDTWAAYKSVLDEGKLTAHVCVLWSAGTTLDSARQALQRVEAAPRLPKSLGNDRLLSCGVKMFMDGSGGARTAWLYQDWNKNSTGVDAGNHGYPNTDPQIYRQMVTLFHDAGVHIGTHAIGDRAIDWVVDSYARAEQAKPQPGLRHSIIHANIPTNHALDTMAMLQKQYDAGYPELQAPFTWWIGDNYAANFGPARSARLEPLATLRKRGLIFGGGSDFDVTPLAARYGLWSSVEREALKGTYGKHPFGTAESVDVHVALRSYTVWAARQLFLEQRTGSLEAGKDADIAVWDRDLYGIPAAQLKDLHCQMTLFQGEVVFRE